MNKYTKLPVTDSSIRMTEDKFWKLVESAQWPCDYEVKRMEYRAILSQEDCKQFRYLLNKAYGILDEVARQKIERIGDDSYSDLLYHIIGLGREQFYLHANNFNLIQERANKFDYKESFGYCLPYDDDYSENSQYTLKNVLRTAKRAMKEIDLFRKLDNKEVKWLAPIGKELDDLEMLIQNFLDNPTEEGMENMVEGKKWVLKATNKIDKFFDKNYNELPRKFTGVRKDGSNFNGMCTAVIENTVFDAETLLQFLCLKRKLSLTPTE